MKFIVLADEGTFQLLQALAPGADWYRAENSRDMLRIKGDAYFIIEPGNHIAAYNNIEAPVFINSTIITLAEMNAPKNFIRLNAWPGHIEKNIWEITGEIREAVKAVLQTLNKKYICVNDEPGFVSARIIAMIINEAFFAKGDEVSSEEDIDTAMKMGTNYPYGPFEWCRLIGAENVFNLLKKLAEKDERYLPAPALEKEIHPVP